MGHRHGLFMYITLLFFAIMYSQVSANTAFPPGIQRNTTLLSKIYLELLKNKIQREIDKHRGIKSVVELTTTEAPVSTPDSRRPERYPPYFVFSVWPGKNLLQFSLARNKANSHSEVTGVNLWIHVWKKEKKNKHLRQLGKKRKGKKIRIRIYSEGSEEKKIAELKTWVKATKWYRMSLPISLIKDHEASQNKTIVLRVECKRCNRRTRLIMPAKPKKRCRKSGRKKKRRKNRKGSSKNTRGSRRRGCGTPRQSAPSAAPMRSPFIVIEQREREFRRHRRSLSTSGCDSANTNRADDSRRRADAGRCCKVSSYVEFSAMDLDDYIVTPAGYIASSCVGTCPRMRTRQNRNRPSRGSNRRSRRGRDRNGGKSNRNRCRASQTSPLSVWLFNDNHDLVQAELPNLVVERCNCR